MWEQETNVVSNSQRVCVRWAHLKENLPTHSESVHACSTAESCVGCYHSQQAGQALTRQTAHATAWLASCAALHMHHAHRGQ